MRSVTWRRSTQKEGVIGKLYTERMEQFFVANGIESDAKKKAVFLTVIGGKAYGLLRNLLSPTKPADADYGTLIKAMKDT